MAEDPILRLSKLHIVKVSMELEAQFIAKGDAPCLEILKRLREKAAESLGISFQQVQKYEKGINHLSAARLLQVAKLFQRDIVWFYGDAAGIAVTSEPDAIAVLAATKDGYALAAAFNAITDQAKRNALVNLVQTWAQSQS